MIFWSQLHLLIDADSWFPRNKNMLAGYLILYANNRQIVSKDFFPLNSNEKLNRNIQNSLQIQFAKYHKGSSANNHTVKYKKPIFPLPVYIVSHK